MRFLNNLDDQDLRLIACIYIIGGILLCFFNVNIIIIGTRILGLVFALVGLFFLYSFFKTRSSTNATPFFVGLPSLLIGGLMMISPQSVVSILPVLIGFIFIVSSILSMQKAFILKDMGMTTWRIPLVLDIFTLIVGVTLLSEPIKSLSFILQLLGLFLILEGCFIFWNDLLIRKYRKKSMEE